MKVNDRHLLITGKSFFLLFLKGMITTQVYNMTEKQLVPRLVKNQSLIAQVNPKHFKLILQKQ